MFQGTLAFSTVLSIFQYYIHLFLVDLRLCFILLILVYVSMLTKAFMFVTIWVLFLEYLQLFNSSSSGAIYYYSYIIYINIAQIRTNVDKL